MHADSQTDRQTVRHIHTYIETNIQTNKQTDSRGKCQQRIIVEAEEDKNILEKEIFN